MICINGELQQNINVLDRGLSYGDGLFETIALINNELHNWFLHYQRLVLGCEKLDIKKPSEQNLLAEIQMLLEQKHHTKTLTSDFIIKIIITRGVGERGYSYDNNTETNCVVMLLDWTEFPRRYYQQGVDIKELDIHLARQPLLATIKHLNRLEQVLAQAQLANNFQEALLYDSDNNIISGVSSNVFFAKNKVLFTPKLTYAGVAGTIRAQIISLCQQQHLACQVLELHQADLLNADEVFFSNSIRGIWPVKSLQLRNNSILNFEPGFFLPQLSYND